ncbi:MAG: cytochrome C oxidase subunit IV family protein [Myxococcales bacterium]|nr:cytochrome C oxidase subunit IV family protein [Myxococcota bacterium]MDW8281852.1 cytochrome C oxidase subunit IV family protein [Myxococcales bacterium]
MMAPSHKHGHDEPHVLPVSVYVAVWAALVVLTGITVYVAHFDFGSWNTIIAVLVATTKASLVSLYFMHLRYDNKFNLLILLGSLMLVAIFFYPTLTDLTTRGLIEPIRDLILPNR